MDIQCTSQKKDNAVIFTIEDNEVNHNNAASLKEKLFLEIADGVKNIILDMKNVTDLDSSGLGALLFGKRQAENSGGSMMLVAVSDNIQTMLRIAQLSRVFESYPSIEDALSALKK